MRAERRKQLRDLLDIIEEDLLIELLHWRDKKSTEFWTAVDQLKSFAELREKVCKN